jgi:hypothetical protein
MMPFSRGLMFRITATILLILFICVGPSLGQSGANLTGVVLDANGNLIVDASVNLHSKYGTLQTVTDRDGRFRFADLVPGIYTLEVKHSGFATNVVEPIRISAAEPAPPMLTLRMEMQAVAMGNCGDFSTVSYEKRKPGGAQLVGVIRPMPPRAEPDASWPETPFSKATVEVYKVGSNRVVASTNPDERGKFRLSGLAIGNYTLKVSYAGYFGGHSKKFQITKGYVTEVTVPMLPRGEANACM